MFCIDRGSRETLERETSSGRIGEKEEFEEGQEEQVNGYGIAGPFSAPRPKDNTFHSLIIFSTSNRGGFDKGNSHP